MKLVLMVHRRARRYPRLVVWRGRIRRAPCM